MISIILIIIQVHADCLWNDQFSDLSTLDRTGGWKVRDTENGMGMFNMVYVFNFCNFDITCQQTQVAVQESLEVMASLTDNCQIVGLPNTRQITQIANGISITFNDQNICIETVETMAHSNKFRTAQFDIICSQHADQEFKIVQGFGCLTIFQINHPAGCPINTSSTSHYIKMIILILIVYFLGGILYNKMNRDQYNMPHKDFWVNQFIQLSKTFRLIYYRIQNWTQSDYQIV